ncbi:MAG: hypothetical protein U0168_26110 [Nannocystaceae bacterium]
MVRTASMPWGEPAAKLRYGAVGAGRLDAVDRDLGPQLLDRRGDAGTQATAADRHHDRVELGHVVEDLERDGAGAGRDGLALERMQHRAALRGGDGLRGRECAVDVVDQHDLAALLATTRDAPGVRGARHDQLRARADRAGGPRHRDGDCPRSRPSARARGPRSQRARASSAARACQAAGDLEQLELEPQPSARRAAIAPICHANVGVRRIASRTDAWADRNSSGVGASAGMIGAGMLPPRRRAVTAATAGAPAAGPCVADFTGALGR